MSLRVLNHRRFFSWLCALALTDALLPGVAVAAPNDATPGSPGEPRVEGPMPASEPERFDNAAERRDWLTPPPPRRATLEEEPERGVGKLAAGIVLTSIGVPATIGGAVMTAFVGALAPANATTNAWAYVLPGVVSLGVGVPLTVVGGIRYKRWSQRRP
jgi:hypothetical protein